MNLTISRTLSLPSNAATQKIAFIGRTGSGKSYGAGVMVEQMLRAGIQVVILDPVGIWYGLTIGTGRDPGFPIPVLGGLNGDVNIEVTGGTLAADFAVDTGSSLVIDVSQFESDADKARFAEAFAHRFFFRKKASPSPVHLVIEECQEFIPQHPQHNETKMLHAFQRMWKLGRNFGIGGSLITQRPQEVSKKALNQTELLFAFQMTGTHERKAMEEWMSEKGIDLGIADDLPSLEVGQAHAWSPQWLRFREKIHFITKTTLNTSSTPDFGDKKMKFKRAPVDLTILGEKMKDSVERAKNEDPKHLRAEITRLKMELAKKTPAAEPVTKIEYRALPIISPRELAVIETAANKLGISFDLMRDRMMTTMDRLNAIRESIQKRNDEAARNQIGVMTFKALSPIKKGDAVVFPRIASAPKEGAAMEIGTGGKRKLLIALAQYPQGMAARRLSILSGITSSGGTWRTYMAELRGAGYVDGGNDHMAITQSGLSALGNYDPLPEGVELRNYWKRRLGAGGKTRIFEVVCDSYPNAISYADVAAATNIAVEGGTWRTYVAELRGLELIEGRGELRASDDLFTQ